MKKPLRNLLKYTIGLPFLLIITVMVPIVYFLMWILDDEVVGCSDVIKDLWRPIR